MAELAAGYMILTGLMALIFFGSAIALTVGDPRRALSHLVAALVCTTLWPYFAWRISTNLYLEIAKGTDA